MRAYYNKRTETITMIPEGVSVKISIRYEPGLSKEMRTTMKGLLLHYVLNHPNVLIIDPKARRVGHRFGYMGTGRLQANIVPMDFTDLGMSLVIANVVLGDYHYTSRGDVLDTSLLDTCIRKCVIDDLLETL